MIVPPFLPSVWASASAKIRNFPPSTTSWLAFSACLVLLFLCYLGVLTLTYGAPIRATAVSAAINVVPPALGGFVVMLVQRHVLIGRRFAVAALGNVALGLAFSVFCGWLAMVLLSAVRAGNFRAFTVQPFLTPSAAWQLMNSVTLYAVISLLAYVEWLRERLSATGEKGEAVAIDPTRLFVRQDDDIRPLDPARIILIRGADDYAEIVTDAGTHFVRATLSRLAKQLGDGFLRVHRSLLVNGSRVSRAEPAGGGRLLLHMENGERVHTSRSGARVLRDRLI